MNFVLTLLEERLFITLREPDWECFLLAGLLQIFRHVMLFYIIKSINVTILATKHIHIEIKRCDTAIKSNCCTFLNNEDILQSTVCVLILVFNTTSSLSSCCYAADRQRWLCH